MTSLIAVASTLYSWLYSAKAVQGVPACSEPMPSYIGPPTTIRYIFLPHASHVMDDGMSFVCVLLIVSSHVLLCRVCNHCRTGTYVEGDPARRAVTCTSCAVSCVAQWESGAAPCARAMARAEAEAEARGPGRGRPEPMAHGPGARPRRQAAGPVAVRPCGCQAARRERQLQLQP